MCTADARSTIDAHGMQSHVRAGRVAATTFSGCCEWLKRHIFAGVDF